MMIKEILEIYLVLDCEIEEATKRIKARIREVMPKERDIGKGRIFPQQYGRQQIIGWNLYKSDMDKAVEGV